MLVEQVNQKKVKFVIIDTLKILVLNTNHIFVMVVIVYYKKSISFNNIAIVYVKENAYRIHFWYMSKYDAINVMNNSGLIYKMVVI